MENKLTWEEIKKQYNEQWVQLVDYDWPEGTPYPRSGIVRTHGQDKKEFHKHCLEGNVPNDSAFLFVGHKKSLDVAVFNPALVRVNPCGN
jgi:hypothetical protein